MASSPYPHRSRPPCPFPFPRETPALRSRLTAARTPPGAGLSGAPRASPNQRPRRPAPNFLPPSRRGPCPPIAGSAWGAAIGCAVGIAKVWEARAAPPRTRPWPGGGRVARAAVSVARRGSELCPPGRWGALRRLRGADPEFWRSVRLSAGAPAAPGTLGKGTAHLILLFWQKGGRARWSFWQKGRTARRSVAGEQPERSRLGPWSHRVGTASGAPWRGRVGRKAGSDCLGPGGFKG